MASLMSLFRGVNVGGHRRMPMADLREVYARLGFHGVCTYVQSGNVVCNIAPADLRTREQLAHQIAEATEQHFGFQTEVVLRSGTEWSDVVAANPFPEEAVADPAKLIVLFLAQSAATDATERLEHVKRTDEKWALRGSELFVHYPVGQGKSKLSLPALEKALGSPITGRNWRTVLAMHALASSG